LKTASIVHPSLNRAGGAERYLLELVNVLRKAGYIVCLYTVDKTDWEKLEEIQGLETRPDKELYRQEKRLEPSNLFSWIKAASIYTWLLVRGREESDLSINNYGEVLPIISDISIVHAVPVIAKNGNAYNFPLWDVLHPIFRYLHGSLTKKTSKIIITNSRYNEKKVNQHYHTETKVVNPPIATASYYGEKKNGRILSIARISPNKNLQTITQIANRSHRNRFIIAGKTSQNSEKILSAQGDEKHRDPHQPTEDEPH
jgi:glycosyltransferase involved in cell wall biosynthesis